MSFSTRRWLEGFGIVALVGTTACSDATGDATTHAASTGGTWSTNTSSASGGTYPGFTSLTGGAQQSSVSVPAGGNDAAGGTGGAVATAGGTQSLGGVAAVGGTSSITSAGGATQVGGAHATGGSSAIGSEVCALPFASGNCDALFRVYFFSTISGQCEEAFFYGCGGNANRFDTLEACQLRCQPNAPCPATMPGESGQCVRGTTCYYDAKNACRCIIGTHSCDVIDPNCQDTHAGTDADASADSIIPDSGGSIDSLAPVDVCSCGTSGWSCRSLEL